MDIRRMHHNYLIENKIQGGVIRSDYLRSDLIYSGLRCAISMPEAAFLVMTNDNTKR